ncbi:MAG: cysteine hydrolase [Candidatus Promineofilum sp.]|nr:cysteine hydrolase [Promineifilum sp.]
MNSLEQIVDPKETALLIIDMQNDYCHVDGACGRAGSDASSVKAIVSPLNSLIENARRVNLKIIFIRTIHDEWTDSSAIRSLPRYEEWSNELCRPDTWGAEFFGVLPQPGDYVITKHRNSAFINTSLDLVLRSIGMKTIIVTGVSTHICVECTVRDGFQYDYFPVVPADCTDSGRSDVQVLNSALNRIDGRWGKVVTSGEIAQAWGLVQD